jgi:hypothetical protein
LHYSPFSNARAGVRVVHVSVLAQPCNMTVPSRRLWLTRRTDHEPIHYAICLGYWCFHLLRTKLFPTTWLNIIFSLISELLQNCFLAHRFLAWLFPWIATGVFRSCSLWKVKMDWPHGFYPTFCRNMLPSYHMLPWKLRHHIPSVWYSVISYDDSSHPPPWEPQFLQVQVMYYYRLCSQHTVRHLHTYVAIQLWSSARWKCITQICIANSVVQVHISMALEITTL